MLHARRRESCVRSHAARHHPQSYESDSALAFSHSACMLAMEINALASPCPDHRHRAASRGARGLRPRWHAPEACWGAPRPAGPRVNRRKTPRGPRPVCEARRAVALARPAASRSAFGLTVGELGAQGLVRPSVPTDRLGTGGCGRLRLGFAGCAGSSSRSIRCRRFAPASPRGLRGFAGARPPRSRCCWYWAKQPPLSTASHLPPARPPSRRKPARAATSRSKAWNVDPPGALGARGCIAAPVRGPFRGAAGLTRVAEVGVTSHAPNDARRIACRHKACVTRDRPCPRKTPLLRSRARE